MLPEIERRVLTPLLAIANVLANHERYDSAKVAPIGNGDFWLEAGGEKNVVRGDAGKHEE